MRWAAAASAPSLRRRLEASLLSTKPLLPATTPFCSLTGELAVAEQVLSILHTVPFSSIDPPLDFLAPLLTPHAVNSVLDDISVAPPAAFRFFVWAARRPQLRSWPAHNRMISILRSDSNGGFDLAWQSLAELRSQGIPIAPPVFTVLIQAYAASGMAENALDAFGRMPEFQCRPNTFTYNTVIRILIDKDVILLAMAIYNQMLKSNCLPMPSTFVILMDGLCKAGKTDDALRLFDEMLQTGISPNTMVYTVFLSSLCRDDKLHEACRLLNSMKEKNCKPDSSTYKVLLNGFCKLGKMEEAFGHLKEFENDGFVLDLIGHSCLIDGLFRAGRFEEACRYYGELLEKNVVPDSILYTIMIRGYVEAGKVQEAFSFLNEMTSRGLDVDTFCYNTLIKGLCDVGLLDKARSLVLEISQNGCFPDSATFTIIICGLCKEGLVDEAQKVFDEMGKLGCSPTVMTFNALIHGLCKAKKLQEAQVLFYKMEIGNNPSLFLRLSQGANRIHDSNSLRCLVEELCQSGLVLKAYKLLRDIINSGVVPDVVTYNILINCLCKAGNPDGAMKLFKEILIKGLSPDAVTYGTLIDGLLKVHREDEALKVFQYMLRSGCTPSLSIYSTVMRTLCRQKKVSQAVSLWLNNLCQVLRLPEEEETIVVLRRLFEQGNLEQVIRRLIEMDKMRGSASSFPYTIWLIGFCQVRKVDEALTIFTILKESNIDTTPSSCALLVNYLCWEWRLDSALDVMLYALGKGFLLMQPVGNRLLKRLCKHNKKDAAQELVHRMCLAGYDIDTYLRSTTKDLLYN